MKEFLRKLLMFLLVCWIALMFYVSGAFSFDGEIYIGKFYDQVTKIHIEQCNLI